MNTNGWLVSPSFAKWIIGTVFAVGVWVTTIQISLGDKAEKIDVATQVATQTEILKHINATLTTMATSLKSLDDRQDKTDQELARLEGKAEAEDK
ncbi:hypothetical protein LCGC14_2277590 [marine sediment metagenome]|uniref:Uncharacterized protein n=1 Tax=marine sediment metagenome TaxID=412755 RepID=A0A0F9F7I5_9ZZZZ